MTDRLEPTSGGPQDELGDPWCDYLDGRITFDQLDPADQERAKAHGLV